MADSDVTDSVLRGPRPALGKTPIACARCDASFTPRPRGRGARFCSAACRMAWHRAQPAARLAELEQVLARASAIVRELRALIE